MYFVWRRSDGYVNASTGMPSDWTQPSDGERVTFKLLGEFEEWKDAEAFIMKNKLTQRGAETDGVLASRIK